MKLNLISFSLIFIIFSCSKKINNNSELQQRINSIFKEYKKENYINTSVLDLYETTKINCSNLNKILDRIYHDDQDVRNSSDLDMQVVDSINKVKVVSIMRNCENISSKNLSKKSYKTMFLVLQHSGDKDLMAFYYDDMQKFVANNKLDKSAFALYIDRFLLLDERKQLFGSQIVNNKLYQLENPQEVNKRRMEMNLGDLQTYLFNFGIKIPNGVN